MEFVCNIVTVTILEALEGCLVVVDGIFCRENVGRWYSKGASA